MNDDGMTDNDMTEEVPPCETVDDADVFFPEGKGDARKDRAAQAQALCALCTQRWPCLEGARARRERYGVWGGVDFEDEIRVRRRAKAAA